MLAAWNRIPRDTPLPQPVTIMVAPGTYTESMLPNYWEDRQGTPTAPIVIQAAGSPRSATFTAGINMFNVDHLRFNGLNIDTPGDVFHCEQCTNVTISNSRLAGRGAAHETIKVNQSSHLTITGSDISGADENAIDFVAVQHGLIEGNIIHGAGDWCAYVKGGSTDITVRNNEIHTCGTGGFTAGQGTGLEYMVAPWLTYEATNVIFTRNFIHDTEGAAFGVNGGRAVSFTDNVATRVGTRSHILEVTFGLRSCDENGPQCRDHLAAGAWGTPVVGGQEAFIPNRDVTIRGNTIVNPPGVSSRWQHFEISAPRSNTAPVVGPSPARTDEGLVITGNIIRNGDSSMVLGVDDNQVCKPSNPTCTVAQLLRDNDINGPTLVPIPVGVPPANP